MGYRLLGVQTQMAVHLHHQTEKQPIMFMTPKPSEKES